MSSKSLRIACRRLYASSLCNTTAFTSHLVGPSTSAKKYQLRCLSDQKPSKSANDYQKRERILAELAHGLGQGAVSTVHQPVTRKQSPKHDPEFQAIEEAKYVQQQSRKEDTSMQPFEKFRKKMSAATYEGITVKPLRHTYATPVQAGVLDLLPGLAQPFDENEDMSDRKDILALSPRGTGKSLAFIVPAIEARRNSLTAYAKNEVMKQGMVSNATLEQQAERYFSKTAVGALILAPTREEATAIANEAILLSRNQQKLETRLFVGGFSKKIQLRDWMNQRRDIVVATPGRLRDLLMAEPVMQEGFRTTSLLVLDQTDQLLEDGFRDDIDAIIEFLPPSPERQTFVFSENMTHAVSQLAKRVLSPNHVTINLAATEKSQYAETPQFHTILPNASYQIPHIMKLIAHDQLAQLGLSKVIVFLPTTRMCQLFTTLVQELSKTCLPAGEATKVYSINSALTMTERNEAVASFASDHSGSSVLITTDVTSRMLNLHGTTRVIQVGIPSSDPMYFMRLGHAARARGDQARGDLVLLPWEMGYLTWQLMDVPFKPLTVSELDIQLEQLSQEMEQNASEPVKKHPKLPTPPWVKSSLTPIIAGIDDAVKTLLPRLDEDVIREAFVSLVGYYIPKSGEIRAQIPVIVQGAKNWTVEACGLPHAPFISDAFLARLGTTDGRTKRFGLDAEKPRRVISGRPMNK